MRALFKRLSIRHKIAATVVLTILLVMLAVTPVTSYIIRINLVAQQQQHLKAVQNLVTDMLEDYRAKVIDFSRLFSNDKDIKDSLFYYTELSGEREHLLRAVTRLYNIFGISRLEVGDAFGRVVASAEAPARFGIDRLSDGLIKAALMGNTNSGYEIASNGLLIKAASPIYHDKERIIGTVTCGILLDNELLGKMQIFTSTHIVITDVSGRPVAASSSDVLTAARVRTVDSEYDSITLPIADGSERLIANVVILEKDRLPNIIRKANIALSIALSFAAATLIAVLLIFSKRLMRPITILKEGVERVGRGDFKHRIHVNTHDEIGELSMGFNRMAESLDRLCPLQIKLAQSEKLAAVGKYAAGIAHEINNPLGNIIGTARLMQKGAPAYIKDDIEVIIKEANRCAKIVNDLLIYSRQSQPKREWVPVGMLIKESLFAVMKGHVSDGISVRTNVPEDVPDIFVDPIQMGQVIRNVLLNAVQAIEGNGSVTIEVVKRQDRMLEIAVTDTGIGMDEDILQKVFYPFFTTKPAGHGTGLGLAISYSIVRNHGGEILAESIKGKGSTFRICLPLGGPDAQADKNNAD